MQIRECVANWRYVINSCHEPLESSESTVLVSQFDLSEF